MKETINSDTYQTLKELKVDSKPFDKAIEPLWKNNNSKEEIKPYSIFVATPVHSECSIHYTQALLELQYESSDLSEKGIKKILVNKETIINGKMPHLIK